MTSDAPPAAIVQSAVQSSGTVLQQGIQLAMHPLAARTLFGMPASELTREVLELDEDIGRQGDARRERLTGPIAPHSAARLVSEWIDQRMAGASAGHPSAELQHAWRLIVCSGGRRRIGDVARAVGWSRRHLTARMRADVGLGQRISPG